MNTAQSLWEDRRVRADYVFECLEFGDDIVSDHDGWETLQSFGAEIENNTWTKKVYFEHGHHSVMREFKVTFRANSCIPIGAYLDGNPLKLPR